MVDVPGATGWVGAVNPQHRGSVVSLWKCCRGKTRPGDGPGRAFPRSFCGKFGAALDFRVAEGQSKAMTLHTPTFGQQGRPGDAQVTFTRQELSVILGLYGRMVAAGEWRDYGMSFLREVAVFSVFRRSAEHPIYRIEKLPKMRLKQGMYSVIGMDGQILKRGQDLKTVLRVLDRKLIRPVE